MDLVFNKVFYTPPKEFWGSFSKVHSSDLFGHSSRFLARILFKEEASPFEAMYKFVIDSGAFISYAPDLILDSLKIKPEFTGFIRGPAPQEECRIRVKVARVPFKLIDDNNIESTELKAWFAFHSFDKGPYLLGMKDILENVGISKKNNEEQLVLQIS